jgi:hypothetical protein
MRGEVGSRLSGARHPLPVKRGEGHARLAITTATSGDTPMVIGIAHLQPIVALVAGIAILIIPRLHNFIVAAYLIVVGVIGLGFIH